MKILFSTSHLAVPIKSICTVLILLAVLILGFLPRQAVQAATVLYAKPVSGTGDCSSWANACSLQTALTTAVSGDEIWVAKGTYKPTTTTNRSITFLLESGVAIYGGFAGGETQRSQRNPITNVTILSGDIGGAGNNDNSYHVVTASSDTDETAILDGFTITAGNATGPSANSDDSGGGMYNVGSPTLSNLIFSSNYATYGGGMYSSYYASPTLTGATFSNNIATSYGGGIFNSGSGFTLTNVAFSNNRATYAGGGIYNNSSSWIIMTGVTFSNNSVNSGGGGGMYDDDGSPATLEDVTFTSNTARDVGGGMYIDYGDSTLTNVTFNGNTAGSGGGLYASLDCPYESLPCYRSHSTLASVTFNNNHATTDGGGMYTSGVFTLTGATFSGNSAGSNGGGIDSEYQIALTDASFITNTANQGGGFYYDGRRWDNTTLSNVTFSSNSATTDGGGLYSYPGSDGNLTLTNTTFRGNSAQRGGGIYNEYYGDEVVIDDSILWGNTASSGGAQIYNNDGTLTVRYSDLQGSCPGGSTCSHTIYLNPLLGSLGDYGGGMQVFPLLPGSPAIDAGNDSTCAFFDQRGISRPQGAHCDLGAFESQGFTLTIISGDYQITRINTFFPDPLVVSVTSASSEPVNSGQITFTAPGSGARAILSSTSVTITGGGASVTAKANGVVGTYTVTANAAGVAAPAVFNLTNSLNVYHVYLPLIIR